MAVEAVLGLEPRDHAVQFYGRDADLADLVGAYLADALRQDGVAIVASTATHARAFEQAIAASGTDPAEASRAGRLVVLDAAELKDRLMGTGTLDAGAFHAAVGEPVRGAVRRGRPVHVFGEIVGLLWDAGQVVAAIELEGLWNHLRRGVPFSLLCAYPAGSVSGPGLAEALRDVCQLHSAVTGEVHEWTSAPHGVDWSWRQRVGRFSCSLQTPGDARRFVVQTLRQWGCHELVDDAALVASELATNAVVHVWSDLTVRVSQGCDVVRISIQDSSPSPPRVRPASSTAVSGRGLLLVDAVASRWGTEPVEGGKAVWAELVRQP